jgi:uncharacterized protein YwgA
LLWLLSFLKAHTFDVTPTILPDKGKPAVEFQTGDISHQKSEMVYTIYEPYMLEVTSIQNEIINEWNKEERVSGLTSAVTTNRLKNFQEHVSTIHTNETTRILIDLMNQQADTLIALLDLLGQPNLTKEELHQVYTYESKFQTTHELIKRTVHEQMEGSYQSMRT